ncbi:uncharacterized protein CTRU02_204789 [Colletotrichum truncatum]|uniref:Uncharacterized protein n=1 Tax=Colletotrichum truncatum TaxID=5467 RepID=A0ACC3ZD49_COLTU|nr:uncharacterized protein CTRU02_03023 [Colletotrichum truncatum]KAF6797981.1 hypothetical protein CTRU02_03023 [Colletotrichum truncatum]
MENVHRILAELSGESRHITLRRALEEKTRDHLRTVLMNEDYSAIEKWYTSDVTMVVALDATLDGEVLYGQEEVIQYFKTIHKQVDIGVVPVLTISDRGRITCYAESYYRWMGCGELSVPPFVGWPVVSRGDVLKVREVVVFDLNEEMKVRRVEWRFMETESLGQVSIEGSAKESMKLMALIQGDV